MNKKLVMLLMSIAATIVPGMTVWASDTEHVNGYEKIEQKRTTSVSSYSLSGKYAEVGGALPEKYAPIGNLPKLRDQGIYGDCWAQSAICIFETGMIYKGYANRATVDYSEKALGYFMNSRDGVPIDPLGGFAGDNNYRADGKWWNGNNKWYASDLLMGWVGATDDSLARWEDMPSRDYIKYGIGSDNPVDSNVAFNDVSHLESYYAVNRYDYANIKKMIMQYGAGAVDFFSFDSDSPLPGISDYTGFDYTFTVEDGTTESSYYCPIDGADDYTNHAVTVVGWDDNFPRTNFDPDNPQPEHDGAWLIRNSWVDSETPQMSYMGYFWLSYEDKSLDRDFIFMEVNKADNYDHIYQYDGVVQDSWWTGTGSVSAANVFEAKANSDGEMLETVAFDSDSEDYDYSIDVYVNPDLSNSDPTNGLLVSHTEGHNQFMGYQSAQLSKAVPLSNGMKYSVVVTLTDPGETLYLNAEGRYTGAGYWYQSIIGIDAGQSYFKRNSAGWVDALIVDNGNTFGNAKIKGYTKNTDTYTVNYHSNNGIDEVNSLAMPCGTSYALYGGMYEKDSVSQTGWNTKADGTGISYSLEQAVNLSNTANAVIDLYAEWAGLKIAQGLDGNWYLYDGSSIVSDYTGLFNDKSLGWWLIQSGRVAIEYNDLYGDAKYGWWKIRNGQIDSGYSDLYCSPTLGWWKVNGGALDFGYTDLYCSPTLGWWKVSGGALDLGYADLYYSPTIGWWKVNNGSLDLGYTDLYCSPTLGWWKVNNGSLDLGYTDLYCSPTLGWWKVNGGALDLGYADLYCSPTLGWWKVNGGALDLGYTDIYYSPTIGWWKVNSGQLDLGFTGLYFSQTIGWWKVVNGALDLGYNGVYNDPAVGSWYINTGHIDFSFTGRVVTDGVLYDVVDGRATPLGFGAAPEEITSSNPDDNPVAPAIEDEEPKIPAAEDEEPEVEETEEVI